MVNPGRGGEAAEDLRQDALLDRRQWPDTETIESVSEGLLGHAGLLPSANHG